MVASFKIINDSLPSMRQIQVFTKTGKNDSYHLHQENPVEIQFQLKPKKGGQRYIPN